ncbi:MAG: YihY/virulence factor BrkB family protein [Solirubrobacterales bacterium]
MADTSSSPSDSTTADSDGSRKLDTVDDISGKGWFATLKRAGKEFADDNCTDWAAALTYYAVLSLFPAIIVMVSLLGLFGGASVTAKLLDIVGQLGPASAVDTFKGPIENVSSSGASAGLVAFVVGLAGALWTASGYTGAFMRASNAIFEVAEGRPFYKLRPVQLLVTLVMVVLVAVVAIALIVSGPLAQAVGGVIGLGDTAITVWQIAKWPVLLLLVSFIISVLYYFAPNLELKKFQWISPGGVLAVVIWVLASGAFAFYVANFGSYNKTYGAVAGVIVFLLWLYITNLAILFGQEINAELERQREIEAGIAGAEDGIQRPWRDEPDDEDKFAHRRDKPAEAG